MRAAGAGRGCRDCSKVALLQPDWSRATLLQSPPRSTRSPRSPTPCCSRATCSTPTAPRRRRTGCAGSSACSPRPASRTSRTAPAPRCLLDFRSGAVLHVRLRFLHLRTGPSTIPTAARSTRSARATTGGSPGRRACRGRSTPCFPVDELGDTPGRELTVAFEVAGERDVERVAGGHVERRCLPLNGRIVVSAAPLPGPYDVLRLRLDVVNDRACPAGASARDGPADVADHRAHPAGRRARARSSRPPTRREWAAARHP